MVMRCTDSNARTAPTFRMLYLPAFHCDLSAQGQLPFQLNVPAGALYAAASWALASAGLTAGPELGFQVIGRYPSWVSTCWSRMVLNEPVVKLLVRFEPRVPPWPAACPADETIPARPPGIFTVTLVFSNQPTLGVNTAALPWTDQLPGIDGDSVGIGEPTAGGVSNWTRTGLVPLTCLDPAAGVIETTCMLAAGWSGLAAAAGPSCDTSEAWLPGAATVAKTTPAPSASAAPVPVRTTPRFFTGRGTLNACHILETPELPATTPPSTRFTIGKNQSGNDPPTDRRARAEKGCRPYLPARPQYRRLAAPAISPRPGSAPVQATAHAVRSQMNTSATRPVSDRKSLLSHRGRRSGGSAGRARRIPPSLITNGAGLPASCPLPAVPQQTPRIAPGPCGP